MNDSNDTPEEKEVKRTRILVCDDSKVVRLTARKMLSDRFDLVLAEDGEQGWEAIAQDNTIQMVFTDLKMPNLDGFELINRVRKSEVEHIRNMPMIVITGSSEDETLKQQIFDAGATDFVSKPFTATTLIARAEAHTNYRKVKTELQKNANKDPLAGVLNKQGIEEQLTKDCAFVNRYAEKIAIMTFELDDFATTYDNVGKKTAELVLKEVAGILVNSLRKEDSVGRVGLAQFIVILPMANNDSVIKLARRLSDRVKGFKLKLKDGEINFTVSTGIASVLKGRKVEPDKLIGYAEQALQRAKSLGAGQIQLVKLEPEKEKRDTSPLSIDTLLEDINNGNNNAKDIAAAVEKLAPLIALMSPAQREALLAQ